MWLPRCRKSRIRYGSEIDIWSAGCIFAELLAGMPLFSKDTEVDALYAICKTCGSPSPAAWPEVVKLPGWESCRKEFVQNRLRSTLISRVLERRRVRSPPLATHLALHKCCPGCLGGPVVGCRTRDVTLSIAVLSALLLGMGSNTWQTPGNVQQW